MARPPLSIARLCGNLLVRKLRRARALRSVLDRDEANVALSVNVEHGVLVKIPGFGDRRISELDQQCVCVSEITNLHGVNLRSKKALWTVSPSGRRTTRKKRFSDSGTCTQRRIRPSV